MIKAFQVIKSLLITQEATNTPVEIEVIPQGTAGSKTTVVSSQTTDRTITVPDVTDTLVARTTTDTLTNKTIVVAANTVTTAASGNLTATELNAALDELQDDIDTRTTSVDFSAHLSDTSTHGITSDIVGRTETQDLSNKTFIDPVALSVQVSPPGTPASGTSKVYVKADKNLYYKNDSGVEVQIGNVAGPYSPFAFDAVVGSPAQVTSGLATHSTLQAAHDAVVAGSVILILKGTYAGATTISKQLNIYGQGYSTVLDDDLSIDAVSNVQIQDIRLNSNLIFSASADDNSVFNLFVDPGFTVTDSGSNNTVVPVSGPLPAGTVLDFAGNAATAPFGFLFAFGQAVSRTTYSRLFAAIGTTHGVGDGSTTFNLPDLRGRIAAGRDDMGGVPALRLTNAGSGILGISTGASGGVQNVTLTAAQSGVPAHTHPISDPGHFHSSFDGTNFLLAPGNNATATVPGTGTGPSATNPTRTASAGTGISGTNVNTAAAASAAHTNVQPTIILNKIIKV